MAAPGSGEEGSKFLSSESSGAGDNKLCVQNRASIY
jgi:hypothetical protein